MSNNYIPNQRKYQKQFRNRKPSKIQSCLKFEKLYTWDLTLIALESTELTHRQYQMIHFILNKGLKKIGKFQIETFSHQPITEKPLEVRMGKGKGNVEYWVHRLKFGTTICSILINKIYLKQGVKILQKIQYRLPIKTKIKNINL